MISTELQREVLPNQVVASGSYWLSDDGHIESHGTAYGETGQLEYIDAKLEPRARIERLDWRAIGEPNPTVLIAGGLHADEEQTPLVFWQDTSRDLTTPRIEAMNVHIAAALLGRREYVQPMPLNEVWNLYPAQVHELILMQNGRAANEGEAGTLVNQALNTIQLIKDQLKQGEIDEATARLESFKPTLMQLVTGLRENGSFWRLGRKIDYNRQFRLSENVHNWDDVFSEINYPEARLMLELLKNQPNLRHLVTLHEDSERGTDGVGEVYFYYVSGDARMDTRQAEIIQLRDNLEAKLLEHGYRMYHGYDDVNDPDLGLFADHGYIFQPNINEAGARKLDGSLESAAVELGRLGINQILDALVVEISGASTVDQKREMVELVQAELIQPFIRS